MAAIAFGDGSRLLILVVIDSLEIKRWRRKANDSGDNSAV